MRFSESAASSSSIQGRDSPADIEVPGTLPNLQKTMVPSAAQGAPAAAYSGTPRRSREDLTGHVSAEPR
jgi:hypothetical protein